MTRRHGRKGFASIPPEADAGRRSPGTLRHRGGEFVGGAPPETPPGPPDDAAAETRVGRVLLGPHAVLAALSRGRRAVRSVFLGGAERGERRGEVARAAERAGVPVQAADRETLDTLARGRPHQGVAALVDDYPYLSLRDFDRLLEEAAHDLLVVALDRVQDPQNLGAVLRSCAAFGVDVVVVPERRAAGVTEAVVRASAGASEWVPVARVPNLAEVLRRCERKGLQVVAVDPRGEERVSEAGLAPPLVLVLGGEGPGLRRLTLERSHRRVRIRIAGALGSINLSVAAGIVLHQIRNAEPDPPIELPGPAECGTRDP